MLFSFCLITQRDTAATYIELFSFCCHSLSSHRGPQQLPTLSCSHFVVILSPHTEGHSSYLQLATYIELVDYTVGFIVFMATIKFLRLLRFNSHINQLSRTLRLAFHDLLYFGATFFIVFGAFSMSAGLLFGVHMYDFSDFVQTLQSLYAIMLGKVDFVHMWQAQP